MSPVALYSSTTTTINTTKSRMTIPAPTTPGSVAVASDIPRRPSPWHGIEHSLSTATTPTTPYEPGPVPGPGGPGSGIASRRVSSPNLTSGPLAIDNHNRARDGGYTPSPSPSPALSTSQALRDWEERLKSPESDAKRHQLVHPPPTPNSYAYGYPQSHPNQYPYPTRSSPAGSSPVSALPPKLVAERDKEGHIEYKLKLIDPTPERFGKLVTQMMWRLKQGKNEAIYELGLADDGTVVGLTRAEMDASLKTLELMASELGATVMILREIVLSVHPPPLLSDKCSSPNLSLSLSSSAYSSNDGTGIWPVRRPDLDDQGQPRRGTKIVGGTVEPVDVDVDVVEVEKEKEIIKTWKKPVVRGQMGTARQVIFDPRDLDDGERDRETDSDEDAEGEGDGSSPGAGASTSKTRHPTRGQRDRSHTDDDIPPFHLDLDDDQIVKPVNPSSPSRGSRRRRRKMSKPIDEPTSTLDSETGSSAFKVNAKRTRAAQKREARRLDLLRGDGMDPNWASRGRTQSDGFFDLDPSDTSPLGMGVDSTSPYHGVKLPHQPTRPSSLRLSAAPPLDPDTTSRGTSTSHEGNPESGRDSKEEDDESMWSLSHMPLDSLSLSFANVHIEDISPPSSPSVSSDTEYATSIHRHPIDKGTSPSGGDRNGSNLHCDDRDAGIGPDPESAVLSGPITGYTGQERICVEALVVRKVQHGHGADGGGEEEEECGWGGEDDVWGLGVDDD